MNERNQSSATSDHPELQKKSDNASSLLTPSPENSVQKLSKILKSLKSKSGLSSLQEGTEQDLWYIAKCMRKLAVERINLFWSELTNYKELDGRLCILNDIDATVKDGKISLSPSSTVCDAVLKLNMVNIREFSIANYKSHAILKHISVDANKKKTLIDRRNNPLQTSIQNFFKNTPQKKSTGNVNKKGDNVIANINSDRSNNSNINQDKPTNVNLFTAGNAFDNTSEKTDLDKVVGEEVGDVGEEFIDYTSIDLTVVETTIDKTKDNKSATRDFDEDLTREEVTSIDLTGLETTDDKAEGDEASYYPPYDPYLNTY